MHSWPDIKLPCLHMFGFHMSFSTQPVFLQSLNKRALSPHYTPEFKISDFITVGDSSFLAESWEYQAEYGKTLKKQESGAKDTCFFL